MLWWNDRRLMFWNINLSFFFLYLSERKGVHWEAEHDPCSGKPSLLITSHGIFFTKLTSFKTTSFNTYISCFYSSNHLLLLQNGKDIVFVLSSLNFFFLNNVLLRCYSPFTMLHDSNVACIQCCIWCVYFIFGNSDNWGLTNGKLLMQTRSQNHIVKSVFVNMASALFRPSSCTHEMWVIVWTL